MQGTKKLLAIVMIISLSVVVALTAQPLVLAQPNSTNLNTTAFPLNAIFKKVDNSVVQITSKLPIGVLSPNPETRNATALGSGFVYDKEGHIITNNHVIAGAKLVDLTFIDGNRYTAQVIGADRYSDLAVLKIIENITKPPAPLAIGNSSTLEVGEQVLAIGNPFGFSNTMTTGIISQTGALLPSPDTGFSISNVILTDAEINPGNSGGPLLNLQGQVIGINTAAILSGTGGFSVGFAIPSNVITRIVPVLIDKGNYSHPYIGISGATLTSDLAESINGLKGNIKGVFINTIAKDGPADKAGLHGSTIDQYGKTHGGDIITAIDGRNVTRIEDFISYLEEHKSVSDNAILTVYRDGNSINLKTSLQGRPSTPFS
jgi:S1-C subfamily serine protease